MTMNQRIRVIRERISQETIATLSELLEEAQCGELIGIAGVALYAKRRYQFRLAGEGERSPTFALGAVTGLQTYISHQIAPPPE